MPWSYNSEDRQGCRSLGQSSEEGEVRWSGGEEDEHVQDDVKMTDGGKKETRISEIWTCQSKS